MISIQRPYAFLFLLLLIPVTYCILWRYKGVARYIGALSLRNSSTEGKSFKKIRVSIILRTVFRLLASISIIFAFAGLSWGTKTIPVQRSGDAVCFVFDISYSMTASDAPDGISRLDAARSYAWGLLDRMEGTAVSIVLAKGDGVIAVPLTDDRTSVNTILESLSPALMTASGSSLGKGVIAAMQSFPHNISQASHIWVFTDGDETDTGLSSALDDAARFGIPVTLIGFGTAKPVEVTAGDGKTKVKTWLHADKMIDAAASANQKTVMPRRQNSTAKLISYVAADSESSAWVLLHQLSDKVSSGESYDLQSVPRHNFFILLAILFFVASYFASEFDLSHIVNTKSSSILLVFITLQLFMSCSSGKSSVLSGTFSWYQKKYQSATGDFLRAYTDAEKSGNKVLSSYASYDLAATYIMQEEYEAALKRLEQIPPDSNAQLKSAAFYNCGIIANRQGDFAAAENYFKKAILADASNMDAKINLEFTHQQVESRQSKSAEKEMTSVNVNKDENSLANAVFNLIQQEEQDRWKKLQSNKKDSDRLDY